LEKREATGIVDLLVEIGKLKKLVRAGWVRAGVKNPESVAEHSFRTAFAAMLLGNRPGLDGHKLLKMCVLHDAAEAVTGDITPFDGIGREEKSRMEEEGMRRLMELVPGGGSLVELWREYEAGETVEARAAREIDKLEMALQAMEYMESNPGLDLKEFFRDGEDTISSPETRDAFDDIKRRLEKD